MNYQKIIQECKNFLDDMEMMKAENIRIGITNEDGEIIGSVVFVRGGKLTEFENRLDQWKEEIWPSGPKTEENS